MYSLALVRRAAIRLDNRTAGRKDKPTLPITTLPRAQDPIWKLGHNVVQDLAAFLDSECDMRCKCNRIKGA